MSAVETWGEMVRVEHEQSDRMRGARPTDHWRQYAHQFKADPRRTDDVLVERLRARLLPGDSLLDVGAGGGRLALPLSLTCSSVTAVEPSPSMCAVLRETAGEADIAVDVVESGWIEATVGPADVVLCSHVVYVVQEIEPFVRKLDQHARRLVLVVVFQASPQSQLYGLWEQAHGEPRNSLPALPQFLPVLDELGIAYQVDELPGDRPFGFASEEEAREIIARRLYVAPGSQAESRLAEALDEALQEEDDGVWRVNGSQPVRPCIVSWTPNSQGMAER